MGEDLEILANDPKWKRFEKLVAQVHKTLAPNARVQHDEKIQGKNSKILRQIDVSIRTTIAASTILVIIQCRDYDHPVDVNDVGEFAAVIEDVGANKGIMVAPVFGFTMPAKNLAEAKGIDLFALIDAENKVWAEYFGNEPTRYEQKVQWRTLVRNSSLSVRLTMISADVNPGFQIPPEFIQAKLLHSNSGEGAGTLGDMIAILWRDQRIRDAEGISSYIVRLKSPVTFVDDPSHSRIVTIRFNAIVRYTYYYGLWEMERLQGFYNYAEDSVTTKEVATSNINLKEVFEKWEVVDPRDFSRKPVGIELVIADYWPINKGVRLPEIVEFLEVNAAQLLTL